MNKLIWCISAFSIVILILKGMVETMKDMTFLGRVLFQTGVMIAWGVLLLMNPNNK